MVSFLLLIFDNSLSFEKHCFFSNSTNKSQVFGFITIIMQLIIQETGYFKIMLLKEVMLNYVWRNNVMFGRALKVG